MEITVLGDACRIIGFGTGRPMHKQTIFVTSDKHTLVQYSDFNKHDQRFKSTSQVYEEVNKGDVHCVFDGILINKKEYDLVVYETPTGGFSLVLFEDRKKSKEFGEAFIASPIYYYDSMRNKGVIIGQTKKDVIGFYDIEPSQLVARNMEIRNKNLFARHSSAIVDLYSNMKPLLVLETESGGNKHLSLFSVVEETVTAIAEYPLGAVTSPVQFIRNPKEKCKIDAWFLRDTGASTRLIQLENAVAPVDALKKVDGASSADRFIKKERRFPVSGDAVFQAEKEHDVLGAKMLKTGAGRLERFHVADIASRGVQQLFFIDQNRRMVVRVLDEKGVSEEKAAAVVSFVGSTKNSDISAVTSADLGNEGKQSLILGRNSVHDGGEMLYLLRLVVKSGDNKVEFFTATKTDGHQIYVPGATHFVGLNNGSYCVMAPQSPQAGPGALSQRGSFVGVGSTHFFLTYFYTSLPFTPNDQFVLDCSASIFPTTITEFTFLGQQLHYRCFFTSPHLHLVMAVLFVTAFITIALIVYLSWLERRKYKIRTENDNIQRLMKVI